MFFGAPPRGFLQLHFLLGGYRVQIATPASDQQVFWLSPRQGHGLAHDRPLLFKTTFLHFCTC